MALTKEAVLEKMKGKDTVVLNVLSPEDFEKLRIKGSINIPLKNDPWNFVKTAGERFGKDKFFITHCSGYSCQAGPTAARALKSAGFKAEDYPGGIEEWSTAGYPTEGTMAQVPAGT